MNLNDIAEELKKKIGGYFNPTSNNGQNFWSSPVAKGFANVQRGVQQFNQTPRFEFKPSTNPNPILRTGINVAKSISESIVNIPRNYAVGVTRTGTAIGNAYANKSPVNLQNLAGGLAPLAESLFDIGTMGGATLVKGIVKGAGKETLKTGAKQAIKKGVLKGAGYGAGGGLTYGLDKQYGTKFNTSQLAEDVAVGSLLGSILGGGVSSLSAVSKLIRRTPQVEAQLRDKVGRWTIGQAPVKPDGMPKPQWDFQLKFNEKYRRNPYRPVMPSDLQTAIKYEAEARAGMTVRDIRKPAIPGSANQVVPNKQVQLSKPQLGALPEVPKVPNQPNIESISSDVKNIISGTDLKSKKLVERMGTNEKYAPELRQMLEGTYVPKTNAETITNAKKLVRTDAVAAETRAMNPQNAVDQAIGAELFNHYMDQGNVQRANGILNATSGTNEGQMIQILSQYDKTSPQGAVKFAKETINAYNKAHPNSPLNLDDKLVTDLYKQAKEVQGMKEGRNRNIASQQLIDRINALVPSTLVDKAITVWKAGLLTSLRTHERNLIGNSVMSASEIVKDLPAAFIDTMLSWKTGKRSTTPTVKGVFSGGKEGLKIAKDVLKLGYDPQDAITKFDVKKVTWANTPFEQALKKYTDVVFRSLGAEDKPFWSSAYARSLYDQAGTEAINLGKRSNRSFIENLVKNPSETMKKNATIDANYATFHDENLLRSLASKIKSGLSKNEIAKLGGELIMPFTGVPSSIAGKIVDYSPLGLGKGLFESGKVLLKDIPTLQRQASQDVGRGVVGSALFALGSYLTSKGLMTGQPKDAAEARQWQLENKPYNSIFVGGKWRNIGSVGPQPLIMLAGAKYQEDIGQEGDVGKFLGDIGKDFTSQTFLAGVQGPMNAISDPARYGKTYLKNQASSVIPNIIKDVAKSTDSTSRETNSVIDTLKSNIPGLRNTLLPKRDALGNQIAQEPTGVGAFVDLTNSKTPISNPLVNELSRLNASGNNATPSQLDKNQTILKNKVVLNPEQLNRIEVESGLQLRNSLNKLIQSNGYQALTDEKKKKAIDDTVDSVRTLYKATNGKDILSGVRLQNPTYTQSKDSPQGLSRVGLYGLALVNDPKATIKAVVSEQPIRKISGNTVVLERQNALGGLDAGDTATQVDHKLALSLGGTNDSSNLQILSATDNAAKGKFETYLAKQLVAGKITKDQAQKMDLNWRNEIGKLPTSEQTKIAGAVKLSAQESDPTLQYQIIDQKTGNVKNIDLTPIKEPSLTGDDIIDKKLKSAYKTALTTQTNNIIALYQDGQITLEDAKSLIQKVESTKTSAKKPKGVTFKAVKFKAPTITLKKKSSIKLPTLKVKKPKKIKIVRRFTIK